jgi:hypothetical protein
MHQSLCERTSTRRDAEYALPPPKAGLERWMRPASLVLAGICRAGFEAGIVAIGERLADTTTAE